MRRSALIGAGLIVAFVVAVLAYGALRPAERLFSTAIPLDQPMAKLTPSKRVCQPLPVPTDEGFDGIGMYLNPPLRGPAVRGPAVVTVFSGLDGAAGEPIATAQIPAGWAPFPELTRVKLDREIRDAGAISVCIRSRSARTLFVWGSPTQIYRQVQAVGDSGRQIGGSLSLAFFNDGGTRLERLPVVFEHMTLFRPPWMGPWFAWILFGVLVVGAPLGLAWALRRVSR